MAGLLRHLSIIMEYETLRKRAAFLRSQHPVDDPFPPKLKTYVDILSQDVSIHETVVPHHLFSLHFLSEREFAALSHTHIYDLAVISAHAEVMPDGSTDPNYSHDFDEVWQHALRDCTRISQLVYLDTLITDMWRNSYDYGVSAQVHLKDAKVDLAALEAMGHADEDLSEILLLDIAAALEGLVEGETEIRLQRTIVEGLEALISAASIVGFRCREMLNGVQLRLREIVEGQSGVISDESVADAEFDPFFSFLS